MPVQPTYPGVYIQEAPAGVRSISGVAQSVALAIGMTGRGPMRRPVSLLNRSDYDRSFGADTAVSEITDQVRQFFGNGGRRAYVMRIANGSQAAAVVLRSELGVDVLRLTAREDGAIGETIRGEVEYDTPRPEATFTLEVYRHVTNVRGEIQEVETEVHRDLTMQPGAARNVVSVLASQSSLVTATILGGAAVTGYAVAGATLPGGGAGTWARVNDAITATGGTTGRFQVSVDDGPFVTVALTAPINGPNQIRDAINAAVAPRQVAVSNQAVGPGPEEFLVIRSVASGGSVRLRRATTTDIAQALGMAPEDGGLEVGGHAAARPAPTGVVSRLGPLDITAAGALGPLITFLRTAQGQLTQITITDPAGARACAIAGGAGAMWNGPASTFPSLANARASLDRIVAGLDAGFATDVPQRWSARRVGFRIALTPSFGGVDMGPAITIASAGGYNVNDAATGILDNGRRNVQAYRLGLFALIGAETGVAQGLDGTVPTLNDYLQAFDVVRREVDIFNLLLLPRATGQTDASRAAVWGPASAFCQERRAFLLVDPPSDWTSTAAVLAGLETLRTGLVKDHAAVYWPRLTIVDPETGGARTIDPTGSVAGVTARTDGNRGVWKAAAGTEATILGVRGLDLRLSDAENGLVNPQAVNAIRVFPTGIVVWGARTVDGFDNSGNTEYRYIPVRRLALHIEESLYRGLAFAVFEPNDEPLWAQIRLAAGAFMNGLFRQGAFQGQKASDAYFVKCDSETTTQTDINLGIVNVVVGFAALRPAEFVVITIKQKAGEITT